MKTCSECGTTYPLHLFPQYTRKTDGQKIPLGFCKFCKRDKARLHRANNLDKITAQEKVYRLRNKERIAVVTHEYYCNHREALLVQDREQYRVDPVKHRTKLRRWREKNPAAVQAAVQRRRARKMSAEGEFTAEEWRAVMERYGYRCLRCCIHCKMTADHIVALAKGGTNWIANIQPLCRSCNSKKNVRTVDYRSEGFYLREVDSQGNITDLRRHLLIE